MREIFFQGHTVVIYYGLQPTCSEVLMNYIFSVMCHVLWERFVNMTPQGVASLE
jgi:hypothetical protein